MNVNWLYFVLGCGLISLNGQAQVKSAESGKTRQVKRLAKTEKPQNTLLWEISGNGLPAPSYLFGTMHILCNDDAKCSDQLKLVIDKSEFVYFEIDMDNMQEILGVLKYVRMNEGQKLSELLSKDEYEKIAGYFAKNPNPIPISMMDRFKPFFISSLIEEQLMNCPNKKGMEQVIMEEAKRNGKEILGLETTEFQAGLFDSIPYDVQAKELVSYIDSIDQYRKNTEAMLSVYKQQNLSQLDSLVQKSDPGMEKYMDLLLFKRNRNWLEKMPGIMKDGTVLFAVGAGHLVGTQGLIELLRKKGYTLTPLLNDWK